MKLVLFDIDGTLVDTGGAGGRAFSRALEEVVGVRDGLNGVRLDGQTDFCILETALLQAGLAYPLAEELSERLYQRYVELLESELELSRSEYRVLKGVPELLTALERRPGYLLGLATGNLEQGAWAKLVPGDLNRYFRLGGFGSDSADRSEVILKAVERSRLHLNGEDLTSFIVIGDTPHDITHGRKAGASVIAVATGSYSPDELKIHEPDLFVESLTDTVRLLDFIESC